MTGPRREHRCGARFRRRSKDLDLPHVPESSELELTALGEAFIEALRHDERFADVIDEPFAVEDEDRR